MDFAFAERLAFPSLLATLLLGCSDPSESAGTLAASGSGNTGMPSGGASAGSSSAGNANNGGIKAGSGGSGGSGGDTTTTSTASMAGSAAQNGGGASGSTTAGGSGLGGSGGAMSGAGGSGGAAAATPSPGCDMPAAQAVNSWVAQTALSVKAMARQWWVWLPTGYDPKRAYPLVFTFHGCGGPDNYPPLQKATGADAIVVRGSGSAAMGCWTYGGTSDDVLFFDAMLAAVEAKTCVDTSRVFLTGYSSGSWFTNTLECVRGDKIRATGSVSGGVVGNRGTCVGKYARIFVHDTDDTTNYFIKNGDTTKDGNYVERARLLAQNHCDTVTSPVPEDPAPCARYQGCDPGYPVVMCQTMGKMHDRQDNLAPAAFWKLFSSL